jgi:tRNA pseudouridine38-40 synthase
MRNIKLVLEYDGTDFVGWQIQASGRSVQQDVTNGLRQILGEDVSLIGAGRTDSGVHARGQVANFHTVSLLDPPSILNGLNGVLPQDIRVHSCEDVNEDFHARYSARERVYRYYLSLERMAIGRFYSWSVPYDLDIDLMNDAAGTIVGEHSFESFCKNGSEVDHYRCIIYRSGWVRSGTMLTYEVGGNRFLRAMVRLLVGTMVDVGRGFMPAAAFQEVLAAKGRQRVGMAAPPQGLILEEVKY